jgi:hypothetical protein
MSNEHVSHEADFFSGMGTLSVVVDLVAMTWPFSCDLTDIEMETHTKKSTISRPKVTYFGTCRVGEQVIPKYFKPVARS